jgi:hypothetical protein
VKAGRTDANGIGEGTVVAELGRVHEVTAEEFGSTLTADHAAAETTLTVASAVDFDEAGGDLAYIDPADEDVTITATYTTCDKDADTVTLAVGLDDALDFDTFLYVVGGSEESELLAQVMFEDEDEAATVRVPHSLRDRLPEGVRDEDKREAVAVREEDDGDLVVDEVLGLVPSIGQDFIDTPVLLAYLNGNAGTVHNSWEFLYDWHVERSHPDLYLNGDSDEFEITQPGVYLVIFTARFVTNNTGARSLRITQGGATIGEAQYAATSGGFQTQAQVTGVLVVTDDQAVLGSANSIELWGRQTSGGNLDVVGSALDDTSVKIIRVA